MKLDVAAGEELRAHLLWNSDQPLRSEPYSIEHLEQHAQQQARRHEVTFEPHTGRRLNDRLEENSQRIALAYQAITEAVREGEAITPDAEWLIDNYYVVEDQLREIREDLPAGFYQELPKLTRGPLRGVPRVYLLALELIAHTDSELDDETIARCVTAYQEVAPLTIGEVWAVPIMLRLGLVENLRRLADQALALRLHRGEVERILDHWKRDGELRFAQPSPLDNPALALQLVERIRDCGPELDECLGQLEQRLAKRDVVVEDLMRREQQRQASNQVSIGNVITSMRLLTALDWSVFFERTNLVDEELRRDPSGFFRRMDFETRDRYRHVVEQLARQSQASELDVARQVVELAEAAAEAGEEVGRTHVGYYLIGEGRRQLESQLSYRVGLRERLARRAARHPRLIYFGGLILATALLVGLAVWYALSAGAEAWAAALVGLLVLLPASEVAVGLVNYLVTSLARPRLLPKLELLDRIPAEYQTVVVIPALLQSESDGQALLERIEMHYLANPQPGFYFALLTDFADAPQALEPHDEPLLELMRAGVDELNARYATLQRGPMFYFLHRERRWNESEQRWMGWERKRGKLLEFNRLLRGATDTSYTVCEGNLDELRRTKFVITVDADTQIPHGAARRLVGALAHPLNRPRIDRRGQCVREGYSILQPRIGFNLASANRSLFSWIYASNPGIDPYAAAVSDVYQDLFQEGSFTGKGIYDVDAFEETISRTFPENHILSHDLIEGCHARVGLVTDIELIDGFPARYEADARRQHRWVRGDWQLLPWLGRGVPTHQGRRRNPLSLLSRWKILDNLRRSLVPPSLTLLLVLGWLVLPGAAWTWTVAGLVVLALPLLLRIGAVLHRWPRLATWEQYLRDLGDDLRHRLAQPLLAIVFLPYKGHLMGDAIARTLWRMFVSRRHLLEWETAAAVESRLQPSPRDSFATMWLAPALSLVVLGLLPLRALPAAAPLLVAWLISPLVAWWISAPRGPRERPLSAGDRQYLRGIGRKTWAYFEQFVTADDHDLPPDNYQEYPEGKVAHRLSPTNEGLYLTSALAARDLGYLGLHDFAARLERNLAALEKLPRHRGHFYNWYDTLSLAPLFPRYISTVDSGNLAACFLTLVQGLEELPAQLLFTDRERAGLSDSVAMVEAALSRLHPPGARFVSPALDQLETLLRQIRGRLEANAGDALAWDRRGRGFVQDAAELEQAVEAIESSRQVKTDELAPKARLLLAHLRGVAEDVQRLVPWPEVARQGLLPDEPLAAGRTPQLKWAAAAPALQAAWQTAWETLRGQFTLRALVEQAAVAQTPLAALHAQIAESDLSQSQREEAQRWVQALRQVLEQGAAQAVQLQTRFGRLSARLESLAMEMDFRFLYNPQRRLFSIGFNLEEGRLDRSHYDMLASEARLASFLAVAKGDTDAKHWFQLGRTLTHTAETRALLSWGGTMFEYLMPALITHLYEGSLLEQTCCAALRRQIEFGRQHNIPWGVSESAFGALNASADYHYQSFGVPGLALKRGLAKDLVISPYSTALAAMLDAPAALENFRLLSEEGADAAWGYYDAIDYTPDRVPPGKRSVLVRCYMAHHHGMSLLALVNCLFDGAMQRRFHAHPLAKATELLLQERVPAAGTEIQPHADEVSAVHVVREMVGPLSRRISSPETLTPLTHLISNGAYSVMVTNAGGGFSRCRHLDVTRWRSDPTRDNWGSFIYVRDVRKGAVWSAAYQPTCTPPDSYEVVYSIDKAEFRRRDGDLETHLEITVSPERNAEIRQVTITNHSGRAVEVELTSYAEIVLASAAADLAHPAFHKLFVQTEYLPERQALIALRRPRDASQQPLYAVHGMAAGGTRVGEVEWESDRQQFLGRGRTPANPAALDAGARLTGTTGAVLDPVFSLRARVRVPASESATVAFITAVAEDRDAAVNLADQYHDPRVVHRTFELAWAQSQVELRHLHLSTANAHLYQRLAAGLFYPHGSRRAPSTILASNRQGQSGLWRYGISGDHPLVLVRVAQPEHEMLVREVLLAHQYWHTSGLRSDVVILNEHPGSYLDAMQEQLEKIVRETARDGQRREGVFLLRRTHVADEDVALLEAAATVSLHGERGSLTRQIEHPPKVLPLPDLLPVRARAAGKVERSNGAARVKNVSQQAETPSHKLRLANRYGGFSSDGREYLIELADNQTTPAPWSNVIANEQFGFLVTESGSGFSWARNSRENKLTSWSNDPVSNPPSEAVYLRDDQTGEFWSATPGPCGGDGTYRIAHGAGYSRFQHQAGELEHELLLSIAPQDPVKFIVLRLHNRGARKRQLTVTYCAEWVLGVAREQTQQFVATRIDPTTGALLATNTYHPEYATQVVFLHAPGREQTVTGDRGEFFGRNGSWRAPAALQRQELSGRTGAGLDPCGAVQTRVPLAPGEQTQIVFLLGQGANEQEAAALLQRYGDPRQAQAAIEQTCSYWQTTLGVIQVKTPSEALDAIVNHWLVYQSLSCRVWGRSAFYQSGGAFGFRDQLQDVMALVYCRPDLTRAQILRAASRQFLEGDVQHWWHPPTGRGIRTKFSDDYLWLVFVTCHYLETTGDRAILDEQVSFLRSPLLEPHEEERYEHPEVADEAASLYEHCLRAVNHGLRFGPHGLPLIGCGDWNDGMNKIGTLGQGESVWVGWFLLTILRRFLPTVEARGDAELAEQYRAHAAQLDQNLAAHAWDGQWYRRAYFDDGTPLGSAQNEECQIDSLPQSWAVLAGSDPERARMAIAAALARLVRREEGLIQLFDPPFDDSQLDPGYIKGYLPGIRENGGQYTHAAFWLIQALALQGEGNQAFALFDLVNPVRHSLGTGAIDTYKVEPYVVAADVYAVPPHTGRGGWTWYTGSAAWMYRMAIESLLGLQQRGDHLRFDPCIPADWPQFELTYRPDEATEYHVTVRNPHHAQRGVRQVCLDGQPIKNGKVPLRADGRRHEVVVEMGEG